LVATSEPKAFSVEELIAKLHGDRPEKIWPIIDHEENLEAIAKIQHNLDVLWTFGAESDDPDFRALAVTVFGKANPRGKVDIFAYLWRMMREDPCPTVQYRAALALFKRGERSTEVLSYLASAIRDPVLTDQAVAALESTAR
jgi:hypothetical protein